MKSATVTKLKATLSEFLAKVKTGEEVIITERGRPIAKIVPIPYKELAIPPHLQELARAGLVRLGSGKLPRDFWKFPRPKDPKGSALEALLQERAEGQ